MSGLQFQDFNIGGPQESVNSTNSDYRASGRIGDRNQLYNSEPETDGEKPRKSNFFSFQFYQQYFDVDTDQVMSRILNSMVPRFNKNFITDYIQPTPDLYGPFWVCVTLVFTTAICGNVAKYVQTNGDVKNYEYGSDFRLVTGASTMIASYVILIPFGLYSLFWYRRSELQYSYLEILCAYGYSLSIFIPVSILWVIDVQWFRWLLIVVSVISSGSVLMGSIWPAIRNDHNRAIAIGCGGMVLLLLSLLAIGFKEFYFDASQPNQSVQHSNIVPSLQQQQSVAKIVDSAAKNLQSISNQSSNIDPPPQNKNSSLKRAVSYLDESFPNHQYAFGHNNNSMSNKNANELKGRSYEFNRTESVTN
ncbi:unnamed protein product [Anisakis simplex]|uniref:Protein YIPF n=1 Tax=Anisakis simplex TaxID=6269 RepID=A0A0M3JRZ8_ANISI|nr:unnamed protein product [Anisakis simplex]